MEKKVAKFSSSIVHLSSWNAQMSFLNLIDLINGNMQDHFIWDHESASKFIDSLLLSIPIPSIYVALYKNQKVIIDGFQRIFTVNAYINNVFPFDNEGGILNISTHREWDNKSFQELSSIDKQAIMTSIVTTFIVDVNDNEDLLIQLFERINPARLSRLRQL